MMYHLDTNILIFMLKNKNQNLIDNMRKQTHRNIKVPSMVKGELLSGAYKCNDPNSRLNDISELLAPYEIIPFDEDASEIFGKIKADLEMKGNVIGFNDLVIAATAMSRGGTIVTNNTKEFLRVEGLQVVDWTKESE